MKGRIAWLILLTYWGVRSLLVQLLAGSRSYVIVFKIFLLVELECFSVAFLVTLWA